MTALNSAASVSASASPVLARAQELRNSFDPAMPIFLLIDPMLGEPLPGMVLEPDSASAKIIREAGWQRAIHPIELTARVQLPAYRHPYLVALEGMNDPLIELTLELAHTERAIAQANGLDGEGSAAHRISGWLQSSMHVEQLAEHLSLVFRVNTSALTKATYLRLVDRRTFSFLRHVIGDERLAARLGRVRSWTYVDATGSLAMLRSEGEGTTPLRLNDDEWRLLGQGESIHRAMAKWLGELVRRRAMLNTSAQQLYAQFSTAAVESKKAAKIWPHRFAGVQDQTTWIALSILHPGIDGISSVRNFMKEPGTEAEPADLLRYLHQQISTLAMNSSGRT